MDLIIHVGAHKSGTTTLQEALWQNAQALAGCNVLYPTTGLYGSQHALIPACLLASHPFLADVPRSHQLDHYIQALQEELTQQAPALTILSSEVFSEAIWDRDGCLDMIQRLSRLFDQTSILLTVREEKEQALSSLRHMLRLGSPEALADPIKLYTSTCSFSQSVEQFWAQSGVPLILKHMPGGPVDLVDHYLGDTIAHYSPEAAALLQHTSVGPTGDPISHNVDSNSLLAYMVILLIANSPGLVLPPGQAVFDRVVDQCNRAVSLTEQAALLASSHLIHYLDSLASLTSAHDSSAGPAIAMDIKLEAMVRAGLQPRARVLAHLIALRVMGELSAR